MRRFEVDFALETRSRGAESGGGPSDRDRECEGAPDLKSLPWYAQAVI